MTANDNEPRRPARRQDSSRRASVAALVVVMTIALALFWVISAIRQHNSVQNCIDSGRHDCVEADDGAR